ncbi:PspC domain-containing protein [Yinghuangia soli]|uniref:PspC domain-containing protein n=1 Tax=Yinghuangia soli TaxID=2908204 RepID=A0AA41Q1Z7_9ACTN|nr:PspC domain-containing protein [Yinghuangia soli]MCF2530058.1 PspC domain-containing protein [Yinghuangia soli]
MTDSSGNTMQTPPPAPPGDRGNPPLIRTVDDRVVAGVAGGLGRHFGVDPVIFRVVLAVLTLFGGLGVLLYGLGWLLMPSDDHPSPLARDVLSGRNIGKAILPGVLTAFGVAVFVSYMDRGFDEAFPYLVVSAILLYVGRNKKNGDIKSHAAWAGHRIMTESAKAGDLGTTKAPGAEAGAAPQAAGTEAGGPGAVGGPQLAPGPAPWWAAPGPEGQAPTPPRQRKPRSYLTAATVSLATVAAGVMWWLDTGTSADISLQAGLAVVLAVLAAGLLVGTFVRGSRWLIVPALAVAALLSAVAAITVPFTGASGERTVTPVSAAQVESPYRMKVGEMKLDLNDIDLSGRDPADPVRIEATIGMGNLQVFIPSDLRVVIDAEVDLGNIDLPNGNSNGWKPEREAVVEPTASGPSRGTVVLDLGVGVGNVEVRHGQP